MPRSRIVSTVITEHRLLDVPGLAVQLNDHVEVLILDIRVVDAAADTAAALSRPPQQLV